MEKAWGFGIVEKSRGFDAATDLKGKKVFIRALECDLQRVIEVGLQIQILWLKENCVTAGQ